MDLRSMLPGALAGVTFAGTAKMALAVSLTFTQTGCCGWNPFATRLEPDVRSLFLTAVRDPAAFDERIPSLEVPEGAPLCLNDLAAEAFELERRKILSCDAFLEGSPEWNGCFDEADQIHNHGVVLGDIANALEGRRLFRSSQGGALLIFVKQQLGPSFYEQLIDDLSGYTPDMRCDLGCV